jgi:Calpain family cysteine protease
VELWVRASQCPNKTCVLYKDKVSALDVKQGALGDCYFLSAISVLGDVNVVDMIKTKEGEWQKTGCFCVRFYREGQEEYVIVDDYFPARKSADGGIEWVFA